MAQGSGFSERRKFKRFMVDDHVFVLLGPDFTEFGQIIDISRDGLSFRYIGSVKPENDAFEIDIMIGEKGFYLEKLSLISVSDCADRTGFSLRPLLRRRCVQFGDLMPAQIERLEYFIQKFTKGQA